MLLKTTSCRWQKCPKPLETLVEFLRPDRGFRAFRLLPRAVRVGAAIAVVAATALAQQQKEYFSSAEVERLRDAQGLEFRVPLYFRMADKRLVALGVKELTEKELDAQKKEDLKLDAQVYRTTGRSAPRTNKEDPDGYLRNYSDAQLLRGYIECLDEVMSFIEDAHNRKQDVRDFLEALEKYTRANRPLLVLFKPRNDGERKALEDAIGMNDEALKGASDALDKIAPTERKIVRPKP
ncbi:MAG TPA: hypothetical protein VFY29_11425 [Terriglobia bacterium]|nr:hypothetical protein [Terriglobia bacterium]